MSEATWPNRSCNVRSYRSVSQHHGMTVIIEEYYVSLPLIACGTNSELSCSARSGLRHLYPFSFSFLLCRTAANQSATTGNTRRGRAEVYFTIAAASTSVRHEESQNISRYAKWVEYWEVSENASRNATRVIEPSNPVAMNVRIAAFAHFKRDQRAVSVLSLASYVFANYVCKRTASVRNSSHITN